MGIVLTHEFLQLKFHLKLGSLVLIDTVSMKSFQSLLGQCTLKSHKEFHQT